ncbi:MAG: carboxypeptidase regulatory-like domain-containing protein, partial [Magnetococcales bacterium]|nr:carboxypeptidase regulatory-like domain-containing protein [Magnetococcales bacterium]
TPLAWVRFHEVQGEAGEGDAGVATQSRFFEVYAGPGGEYKLYLPGGLYQVEVGRPGYVGVYPSAEDPAVMTMVRDEANVYDVGTAAPNVVDVVLTAESQVSLVNVQGTVTRSGAGAGGVVLRAHATAGEGQTFETMTGPDGRFSGRLPPGAYKVEIQVPGFAGLYPSMFNPDVLVPDADNAYIFEFAGEDMFVDFDLTGQNQVANVVVTGTATDADDGSALVGATILAQRTDGPRGIEPVTAVTDGSGAYRLELQPGSYKVRVRMQGYAGLYHSAANPELLTIDGYAAQVHMLYAGATGAATQIDFAVRDADLVAKVAVTGTVTDASQAPVVGARVELIQVRGDGQPGMVQETMTDEAGGYEASVIPGAWHVVVFPRGFSGVSHDAAGGLTNDPGEAKSWTVASATVVDFALTTASLVPAVTIAGTVTNSMGPVAGVRVVAELVGATGELVKQVGDVSTGPNGQYSLEVMPGSFKVKFELPGFSGVYPSEADPVVMTPEFLLAKVYAIAADTVVDVSVGSGGTMTREDVTLSGTVTDSSGAPVVGVRVMAQPEWDPASGTQGRWEDATTDASGRFSMGVAPALYRVEIATKYMDWSVTPPVERVVEGADGNPLTLVPGFADGQGGVAGDWNTAHLFQVFSDTTVDVTMQAGKTLSGVVVKPDGTPVPGAHLNIHSTDWTGFSWAESGTDGSFSANVTPGKNYVHEEWPVWCGDARTAPDPLPAGCAAPGEPLVKFTGGNWVTPPDATWVSGWSATDSVSEPVVRGSAISATTVLLYKDATFIDGQVAGMVPGAIMAQWDPHIVTQILVDQSVTVGVMVDSGRVLKGRLTDGSGAGIPDAWVDSDFGGAPTGEDGTFELNIPSASQVTAAKEKFQVRVWPQWCDPNNPNEDLATCEAGRVDFMGGVVAGTAAEGYRLSADWSLAAEFATDSSDWPTSDIGSGETGLVIRASSGVKIVGTVTDGTAGVPGVWVNAWSRDSGQGGGDETSATGAFSIQVQPPTGDDSIYYEVNLWTPDFIPPRPVLVEVSSTGVTGVFAVDMEGGVEDDGGFIVPQPGERLSDGTVSFVLSQGNTISGRVVDSEGKGLPWMWVDIHTADYTQFRGASTDENGFYSVKVEPAADYIAVVWGGSGSYRTNFYKGASSEESATLIDVTSASAKDINFQMSSGASVSGTISGIAAGKSVWLNLYSEQTGNWGGGQVDGVAGGGEVSFTIKGLGDATDYKLNWNSVDYMSGYYGGVPGSGTASGPVGWEKASLISTTGGNVTGVKIAMGSGSTLTLTVTGLQQNEKVDAGMWSDSLQRGGWKDGTATTSDGAGKYQATLVIPGLDSSGTDYRLYVGFADGKYKAGNYKGDLTATTAGSLVGWDRATLIGMSQDLALKVAADSGASIAGTVSGLTAGQRAFVDAWSESTWAWGGTEVIGKADGTATFTLSGLERASDFRVSIWAEGLQGGYYDGTGNNLVRWEDAGQVNVSTGNATGIALPISAGVSIKGTVAGLKAKEWASLGAWSNARYSWGSAQVTSKGGASESFAIGGLAKSGDYLLSLDSEGYMHQELADVSTAAGDATTTTDARLAMTVSSGGSIKGSISGLGAYEWAWVDAYSPSKNTWAGVGVTADSTGKVSSYAMKGVAEAADYVVGLWTSKGGFFYKSGGTTTVWSEHGAVTVKATGDTTGIDFDLGTAASKLFKLTGTISGLTSETSVVDVFVSSSAGGWGWANRTGNGAYTVEGLPAGSYKVEVTSPGLISSRLKSVTVTTGDATGEQWTSGWDDVGTIAIAANTSGLDVALSAGYSISGTVTTGGVANAGVWVSAYSSSAGVYTGDETNSSGAFRVTGLPDGTYTLEVWTPEGEATTTVTISGADQTRKTLEVAKKVGGIKGTVKLGSGAGASGALVLFFDASGTEVEKATTGTDGSYSTQGLAPGTSYTVKVFGADNIANWSTTTGYATGSATAASPLATLDLTLN